MPILEDQILMNAECDFSNFEAWFIKTVENQNSNWFNDELQPESNSTASPYFYSSNSSDDVFSESSPSTLSPLEQTDFLFTEDFHRTQFTSINSFDPFEFGRPTEERDKDEEISQQDHEQKSTRTKPVRSGQNQLGGTYLNGRPLSTAKRMQIIEMSSQGIKPCQISRTLRISHGCVSKILSKYQKTGLLSPGKIGGSKPKKSTQEVVSAIAIYKKIRPSIFSWEIRDQLLRDGICEINKCPSISSINRIIRTKLANKTDNSID